MITLALPLLVSAASLAIAAPANPQRRENSISTQVATSIESWTGDASSAAASLIASTVYASYDNPSSTAAVEASWTATPSVGGGGCSPVTVTMVRGAAATATVIASSAFGSSEAYIGSSSERLSWISSADGSASYASSEPIYTIQTGWIDSSAAAPATWTATGSGSAAVTTATASFAKRQVVSSAAPIEVATSTADAVWTSTYPSGSAAAEAASSTFAEPWVSSAAAGEVATSTVSAWESGSAAIVATSTVIVSSGYYTSTASGCAPTVTVWVDYIASATSSGFHVSSTGVSSGSANQTASRAQAQQNAIPASGASSTIISGGAALMAVGAAIMMV